MVSSRKRRRISSDSGVQSHNEQQGDANARSGKEMDIWEAFREEYTESVEQLPLSLHRNFALLNEIDVQAHVVQSALPTKIKNYVEERRVIQKSKALPNSPSGAFARNSIIVETGLQDPTSTNDRHHAPRNERQSVQSDNRLVDISRCMNVLLRATEEKVNLAQAVYDSVDRHVRLLDQTISEHGLHGKIDPQATRNNLRLFPNTFAQGMVDVKKDIDIPGARQGTRRGIHKLPIAHPPSIDKGITNGRRSYRPTRHELKGLSANPVSAVVLSSDMPVDPNEPVYCYCRSVSFGEMIACDAEDCEYEWFHLDCVVADGKALDKSKQWFCKICRDKATSSTRKRG